MEDTIMLRYKNVRVLVADGKKDSQGDSILIENVELERDRVPVNIEFDADRTIGRAFIRKEGNEILADIEIESREDIEELYPCIAGLVTRKEDQCCISIGSIGLSKKNTDFRIDPLLDYIDLNSEDEDLLKYVGATEEPEELKDPQLGLRNAMAILRKHLRDDEGYRQTWVANIAMMFKDECNDFSGSVNTMDGLHYIANKAAERFIDNLLRDGK